MVTRAFLLRMCRGGTGAVDTTAPVITSAASISVAENTVMAHQLTANEPVTWSIRTVGQNGASVDYDEFEIVGSVIGWAGGGTKDYEAPTDTGANNSYVAVVRATDTAGNWSEQTLTVTVTDVSEGLTPTVIGSFEFDAIYDVGTDAVLSATGGVPYPEYTGTPPYRIALAPLADPLPAGLGLSVDLDGSPRINGVCQETTPGIYTSTAVLTDSGGNSTSIDIEITVPAFPATLTVEFGSLTRKGFGGHRCGSTGGTITITGGNGAGHWAINADNQLVPAGTYNTAAPTFSGSYTLTLSNAATGTTQITTVNMVAGAAHAAVGPTGNLDTNSLNQWRAYAASGGGINLGSEVILRNGRWNLSIFYDIAPQASYSGSGRITFRGEWADMSVDQYGHPRRQHGARPSVMRIFTPAGGGADVPFDFEDIFYLYEYASASNPTYLFNWNDPAGGTGWWGINHRNCRFECAASVTGATNTRGIRQRGSTTSTPTVENCTFVGLGYGVVMVGGTAAGGLSTGASIVNCDFDSMSQDCINVGGDVVDYLIQGNFAKNYASSAGSHPDFLQGAALSGGVTRNGGLFKENISINLSNFDSQGEYYGNVSAGSTRTGHVSRNNIMYTSTVGSFSFDHFTNLTVECCTALMNLAGLPGNGTILANASGGSPSSNANVLHCLANAISMGTQAGAVVTTPQTIVAKALAAYQACFPHFDEAAMYNRAMAKRSFTPLEGGPAANENDTYDGALFPDGSWNDKSAYAA